MHSDVAKKQQESQRLVPPRCRKSRQETAKATLALWTRVPAIQSGKRHPQVPFFIDALIELFCCEVAFDECVKLVIEQEHIGIFTVAMALVRHERVVDRQSGALKGFFHRFTVGDVHIAVLAAVGMHDGNANFRDLAPGRLRSAPHLSP